MNHRGTLQLHRFSGVRNGVYHVLHGTSDAGTPEWTIEGRQCVRGRRDRGATIRTESERPRRRATMTVTTATQTKVKLILFDHLLTWNV